MVLTALTCSFNSILQSGITEEVRDLIRNVKHAENVDEWTKGYGIGDKVEVKAWRPNWNTDIDDDQHFDMTYYPHKGKRLTITAIYIYIYIL